MHNRHKIAVTLHKKGRAGFELLTLRIECRLSTSHPSRNKLSRFRVQLGLLRQCRWWLVTLLSVVLLVLIRHEQALGRV